MFRLKANNINYGTIVYKWLESKRKEMDNYELKEQSYLKYLYISEKYIIPKFKDYDFSKMTDKSFQNYFDSDEIKNRSLSSKKLMFYVINASCKYGIAQNYKTKINKLESDIKTPKPRIVYLTKYDQKKLEELLYKKKDLKSLGILMCLYTGLRIGELCALRWCDIDFKNKCYHIEHTVQRVKNIESSTPKTKIIISNPKTPSSNRIIPIPDFLISILKEYKNKDNIFIFSGKAVPRDPRTFESYFERILEKCGIGNINFHALRHTFATRSLEAGMDIKTLSEILGHSSYRITLDIYVHSSFDLKKDAINVLVNYLNKGKRNK